MVTHTLDRVEETSEKVQQSVMSPVRQVSGIVQAISVGVGTFFNSQRHGPQWRPAGRDVYLEEEDEKTSLVLSRAESSQRRGSGSVTVLQARFDQPVRCIALRIILAAGMALGFPIAGYAQSEACPPASDTETDASSLKTWQAVFHSYNRYWRCDDGAIAEEYSDSVASLLAEHWDQFAELLTLTKKNPKFQAFVLRHVDARWLTAIHCHKADVRSRCPSDARHLCRPINKRLSETGLKGDED